MPDLLTNLFDSSDFMPRRICGRWSAELIRLHIGSDALIWLAYMTIPVVLALFVRRRRDLPFPWIFWMFGVFITTCGFTHLLEATAFYWPAYRLMGTMKLITAVTSWATIVGLVRVFPEALALLSLEGFRKEIDERKRVELELKESEEQVRLLLDSTGEAIFGINLDGYCTMSNAACLRLLGYGDARDLIGKDMHRLIHHTRSDGTSYPVESGPMYQAFRREEGVHIEDEILWRADGTSFPAEYWSHPLRRGQEVVGVVVTFVDISERKRVEEVVRQGEERLRLALDAGFMGTWDWDLLTNEVAWSDNLEAIFGLPSGHFDRTFEGYRRLTHPADRERVERVIARSIEERLPYEIEHRIARPDGSIRWISGKGKVVMGSDGRPARMIGVATDVTERKQADRDLRDYADRLEVLSRRVVEVQEEERRHIARELHDEIGQILSAIWVNLHAAKGLSDAAAWPRLDECLGIVDRAVEQVRGLALDLRPSMLDDLGLAAALRWLVDRQAQRADVVAHFAVRSSGSTLAPDLSIACFRVAQEALTNMVRHARARQVWVELRQGDEEVKLVIRDDGVGFVPEEARRHAARGESLGLLGIKERIALLHGLVTIESAPGQGTTITIQFPLASAPSSDNTSQ